MLFNLKNVLLSLGLLLILNVAFIQALVKTTTTKIYLPFRIHEKGKLQLKDIEKDDVSGKFWFTMNYTTEEKESFFDINLTRFDVRKGDPDDNFPNDIDRIWADSKGWPMDLVMTFPDISLSFTIPKSTSKSHVNLKIPFNLPSAYLNPIPKIIHSALVGKANVTLDTIPEAISESVASFRLQNPDYQYRFIGSLEEMRKDILDFEGNATLHAFDTLTPMAYKVDLWRIVMMFHFGGVYCDSKLTLEQPLDILLSQHRFTTSASQSILVKDQWRAIQNSFMAMPPGTEFARRSIDAIVKNVQDRVYHNVLGITGPFLLMSVFDSLEVKDKAFFNFLAFDQPVFDFSIYSQEPGQEEAQKLRKDRVVIFHNGEYRRHSSSTGAGSYEKMFNDCQVYGEKTPSTKCHVQNPESVKNASNILHTMQLLVFTLTLASFTFISSR